MFVDISKHYDLLIENGNDPIKDTPELKNYMDKWDGQLFINALNLSKEKSCLEIGCGTGRILQKILGEYKSYTGIDISNKTICVAKEYFSNEKINFITGDFLKYVFLENFDLIFSTLTFMHIKEKEGAIKKVYDLLFDDGRFVLSIDKKKHKLIIDTGYSKIRIYPDKRNKIKKILNKVGFRKVKCCETEFAFIFTAIK